MKRRTVRITPLGYIVLIIIILVMVVSIYFIVWSMRNAGSEQAQGNLNSNSVQTTTPTPSLAPVAAATDVPSATTAPTTTAPAASAPIETPKQDDTPEPEVKTPSPAQIETAVDGTLNSSGVALRKGPAKTYTMDGKYASGTQLKVYEFVDDFYFVKIVKENKYGYIWAEFVSKAGIVPGENATPTPKGIAGTIPGIVSASKLALRSVPSTEDNKPVGEAVKGDAVLIFFKTGDFYYIQVVATNVKCYAAAKYITASTAVPTGTPVP